MAMVALLNRVRIKRKSLEAAEHVSSLVIVGDDSLVPLGVLVDVAVGMNSGVKLQVDGKDGNRWL